MTIHRFLKALASDRPEPGGGAAAALAGALGAGLGAKVGRVLLKRKNLPAAERGCARRAASALTRLAGTLEGLIRKDAEAYAGWVRARRTGRDLDRALEEAVRCPLEICEAVTRADGLTRRLAVGRASARHEASAGLRQRVVADALGTDLEAARTLLKGAFRASAAMIEANLQSLNPPAAQRLRRRLARRLSAKGSGLARPR